MHVSESEEDESSGGAGSGREQDRNTDLLAKSTTDEPAGVFGPVMMFLACLLALGVRHTLPYTSILAPSFITEKQQFQLCFFCAQKTQKKE